MMNDTHDPSLRSWIESANDPSTDFPPQNLPFGVFRRRDSSDVRVGVAIGMMILDVGTAHAAGLIAPDAHHAAESCRQSSLNDFMALGTEHWSALRAALSRIVRADTAEGSSARQHAGRILVAQNDAEMFLPAYVHDYTDFYASVYHATNVGSMFRPDQPLLPNYKWVRERDRGTSPGRPGRERRRDSAGRRTEYSARL
jgi:fumarylacetoacetase